MQTFKVVSAFTLSILLCGTAQAGLEYTRAFDAIDTTQIAFTKSLEGKMTSSKLAGLKKALKRLNDEIAGNLRSDIKTTRGQNLQHKLSKIEEMQRDEKKRLDHNRYKNSLGAMGYLKDHLRNLGDDSIELPGLKLNSKSDVRAIIRDLESSFLASASSVLPDGEFQNAGEESYSKEELRLPGEAPVSVYGSGGTYPAGPAE